MLGVSGKDLRLGESISFDGNDHVHFIDTCMKGALAVFQAVGTTALHGEQV